MSHHVFLSGRGRKLWRSLEGPLPRPRRGSKAACYAKSHETCQGNRHELTAEWSHNFSTAFKVACLNQVLPS